MSRPDSIAADLFDYASRYPGRAGHKATDTSAEAATVIEDSGRAAILRQKVLALYRTEGVALTADECASFLRESVLAIRPRVSELGKQFLIKDSGERRQNESGRNAIVWVKA